MGKTRDNGYKLCWERFYLDIVKNFFTVRTISHWNNFPRCMVEFPPREAFKMRLDRVLDNVI